MRCGATSAGDFPVCQLALGWCLVVDLAGLRRELDEVRSSGRPDTALGICRVCVQWLPVTGAAIAVMASAERQELVAASDAVAARIDELQFALGEGPCVEAFETGRVVLVHDIAAAPGAGGGDGRWPTFAAAAQQTAARGMYVFPLHVGSARLGVLDCYRDTPGALDQAEVAGALHAADAAVSTLLAAGTGRTIPGVVRWERSDGSELARSEVHQATGMIMEQVGGSAADALSRLRAAAFAANRAIDAVARDVVDRRLRFDEETQ